MRCSTFTDIAKQEPTIRSIAGGFGMTLEVTNRGHHWQFKRPGWLLEWWPSTGRYRVNKAGQRWDRISSLEHLRKVLAAGSNGQPITPLPPKTTRPKKEKPIDGRDLEPDFARTCDNCENVGVIPLTGMCGPCTYGTAEALEW